jgi:hypothetical protein
MTLDDSSHASRFARWAALTSGALKTEVVSRTAAARTE